MRTIYRLIACCLVPALLLGYADDKKPRTLGADDLKALSWRNVGPANMGGRVACVAFAPGNSKTFFVAFGTSGLWKTTNRGTTFTPVFDKEATSSIGSVQVVDAPAGWSGWKDAGVKETDPTKLAEMGKARIVWVGTGEGNGRNSSSWGHGVYRSTDGGSSWKGLGLEDSMDIPALAVDPRNPDVCYVAALGHLWGPNKMRGVYKTSDGGKSWHPSLQIDENTGAIDVRVDPKDPDTVYAAMYHRHRTAYSFESGGPQGGIYRSKDGGRTWQKLTRGLPPQTGRIGLDIFLNDPKILYAVIESDEGGGRNIDTGASRKGGVFRSNDGGDSWTRVNVQAPRAFYFSKVRVDPKDDQRVYLISYDLWYSTDGGKSFISELGNKLHGDWHAMAIDPDDTEHLLMGSDGGVYQSFDRGQTWDFMNQMAVGEFYNIGLDNSDPFRIIGGLQDNGTWMGPGSTTSETGSWYPGMVNTGIWNANWVSVGGSDGFHAAFDPADPNVVYGESQGGGLYQNNLATGEVKFLQPSPKEGQPAFRFNWNTPFFVSPHDPSVLYLGGNCVFKLTERGANWRQISPDLTTHDPDKMITTGSAAETHCTVVALSESNLAKGLLWAGSDDGLIHVTTDDGAHWQNVTPKTVNGWYVANVEASHHDRNTAYAAIDAHRSENYDPHILMTADLGKTWKDVTGDLPKGASVRVVREDIKNASVLYCGTETGIYVSTDKGGHWIKLNGGSLPTVGVHDILQHPRTMDLVIATHGRSIWVMDNASALSQLSAGVVAKDLRVFPTLPTKPVQREGIDGLWGDKFFGASNAATGARIDYWCKDREESASIKIETEKGDAIATLSGPASPGLNRVLWDMQPEAKRRIQNRGEEGTIYVPAGNYKVTVTVGKNSETVPLTVLPYPYNSGLPLPPAGGK